MCHVTDYEARRELNCQPRTAWGTGRALFLAVKKNSCFKYTLWAIKRALYFWQYLRRLLTNF